MPCQMTKRLRVKSGELVGPLVAVTWLDIGKGGIYCVHFNLHLEDALGKAPSVAL